MLEFPDGHYITVNHYGRSLNLIRFGWIDQEDWKPQKSQTGQMAALGQDVYDYKLRSIKGEYRKNASIDILPGIGMTTRDKLHSVGINTLGQLLQNQDNGIEAFRKKAEEFLK